MSATVVSTRLSTEGEVEKIISSAVERNRKLLGEWTDMFNNNVTPLPACLFFRR
jgi:hypothetical protein